VLRICVHVNSVYSTDGIVTTACVYETPQEQFQ